MFPKTTGVKRQAAVALLVFGMIAAGQNSLRAEGPVPDHHPMVIAHRGFSGIAPENTLPAFRLAVEAGADLVELDYHHSSDGVPVVIHDSTLKRTTDIESLWKVSDGRVTDYTLEHLRKLDAGSWFDRKFTGTRLPTLEEALRVIQKGSTTLIEQKGGDAETLLKLLRKLDCVDSVMVQSFNWDFLGDCRKLDSSLPLGALGPPKAWKGRNLTSKEKVLNRQFVDHLKSQHVRMIGWNRGVTPDAVEYAHSLGLKVFVYTIDEPVEALALVSMGVDGIITNQTTAIKEVLRGG